ncbi:MAG: CinA family protein [Chloroflexota bacterium]
MNDSLEAQVGIALRQKAWTLALAESCTGGLVSHRITQIAGSSEYLLGGVVAYSDLAKRSILGVDPSTLADHGAVSAETAMEMARGARLAFSAQVGLSVTGIAGPSGGSEAKPVGLTYIGVITPEDERVERYLWTGDRQSNKEAAAQAALELLLRAVRGEG